MRAIARGLAVLAVTAAASWSLATAASAAPMPAASAPSDPCEVADGYEAPPTCKILVDDPVATCTDDLSGANMTYAVTAAGGLQASSVNITFKDGNGQTAAVNGKPLTGSVPWPSNITATSTTVTFTTTTATPYTASVAVSTPECMSQVLADEGANTSAVLASTGSQVGPLLGIAGGLVVVGGVTLLLVRRRRAEH
jgi:LPXTG-motif cell wall-anchored protein